MRLFSILSFGLIACLQFWAQASEARNLECISDFSMERLEMAAPQRADNGKWIMKLVDVTGSPEVELKYSGTIAANQFDVKISESSPFSMADGSRLIGKKQADGSWNLIWHVKKSLGGEPVIELACE